MHTVLRVFVAFISALLLYLGRDVSFATALFEPTCPGPYTCSAHIEKCQDISFIIGLALSALIFPIEMYRYGERVKAFEKEHYLLVKAKAESLYEPLKASWGDVAMTLRARIFLPKRGILNWLHCTIGMKLPLIKKIPRFITLYHHPGLCDAHDPSLRFEVSPSQEGIVGRVFNTGEPLTDENLDNANTYHLNKRKLLHLSQVRFCAAIPITTDGSISGRRRGSGKILAVLSFDSERVVRMDTDKKKEDFKVFLSLYAALVEKHKNF